MANTLSQLKDVIEKANLTLGENKSMPAEVVQEQRAKRKPQVKMQSLYFQSFKNFDGEMRFNIYGLGVDGYMYKKIKDGHGWIQCNMDLEYVGELQKNKDYKEEE